MKINHENDEVKERILDGAIELFLKYGIKRITVDDIARHFTMSKKTFYQHFRDKDEMILLATKKYLEKESKDMLKVAKNATNAVEHLHLSSQCMRENFKNLNQNVLFDLKRYYNKAWELYLNFEKNVIFKKLKDILQSGIKEGYFRTGIEPDILAKLRVLEIQMSFDTEIFPEDKNDVLKIQTQLLDHFIYGILTPKGLELFDSYKNQLTYEQ